jgi:predicted lipid-binding transport protein (Tim44 family)
MSSDDDAQGPRQSAVPTEAAPPSSNRAARMSEQWSRRPTHARGRRFWTAMIGVWPLSLLIGFLGAWAFGGNLLLWAASALAMALAVVVLLPQVLFEADDGDKMR